MKKVFAFIFMTLLPLMAISQYFSVTGNAVSDFSGAWNHTIIRNDNNRYGVGYIRDSIRGWFYEVDVDGFYNTSASVLSNGHKAPLPDDWNICDMQIVDDYVYFCGTNLKIGIFGFFKKYDLYTSSAITINYFEFNKFYNISKINVYGGLFGEKRLAAVGNLINDTTIYPGYGHCLIEMQNIANNYFSYVELPQGVFWHETVQNIHKVGDTLIFVGMDGSSSPQAPCFRKAYAYNILGTSDVNTVYHVWNNSSTYTVLSLQLTASTMVDSSYLMLAHQCHTDAPLSASVFINAINIHTANLLATQKHFTENRVSLHDMVYLAGAKLAILNYSNANPSQFLLLNPIATTPYSSSFYYSDYKRYTSIDTITNKGFVSAGESHWFLQLATNLLPSCYGLRDVFIDTVSCSIDSELSNLNAYDLPCAVKDTVLINVSISPVINCNFLYTK